MNNALSESALHQLRVDCYADPVLYARTFHWDEFYSPMSWVHRGMLALLLRRADFLLNFGEEQWKMSSWTWDEKQLEKIIKYFRYREDPHDELSPWKPLFVWDKASGRIHLITSRFTALMLPRGVGKTTITALANEMAVVYRDTDFLVYVSETGPAAKNQLGNLKRQLETNEALIQVFGQFKPARTDEESWREDHIETLGGVVVVARGRGGQIRGLNINFKRPKRIVVDDVEDKESVSTSEQLQKAKTWFWADLVPALPQMSAEGEIIMAGTLLHPDALLMNVVKDKDWVSVVFGALDPEDEPIAPFYMSKEQYLAKRQTFARQNMLTEFEMEYGSRVFISDDSRKFKVEQIKIQIMSRTEFLAVAEVIDPAISEERKADFTSIPIVGMTERGQLHVLDCFQKVGMLPREQVDKFFELHFLWNPTHHGVETIAYQAALQHLLQEEMFRYSHKRDANGIPYGPRAYFEITKITHGRTRKEHRVEGILSPRYAAGYITHQRYFPELVTQLRDWPLGKMDGPDSVSMAVALLDPFAPLASWTDEKNDAGEPLMKQFTEDQYKPLDLELGEWRSSP